MKTLWHLELNIAGALLRDDLDGLFTNEEGKPLTDEEARQYLLDCQAEGKKVLPVGECEGFCFENGCPGHEIR